jgi:Na+/H+ antiporter NhaD/arsenite permease-like protein
MLILRAAARAALAALTACAASPVLAAGDAAAFDGALLSRWWAMPFVGLLLSIAIVPLFSASFWHRHYGKFALGWALALLVPLGATFGTTQAWHQAVHALLLEYVPFVVVLFALYTVAGGVCIHGHVAGTPLRNTGLLAVGGALASIMGTTGASMLLVRPLLAGNEGRRHRVHAVFFFILIVGNIGGALSPLGDPPLFIGYLKGVDFFWTTRALLWPMLGLSTVLLLVFFILDTWFMRHEPPPAVEAEVTRGPFAVEGGVNLLLLAAMIAAVLMSGMWKPGVTFTIFGTPVDLEDLARDAALVALALVSLAITPRGVRERNAFHWGPIIEVAKLFAGIFLTIIPVIAMLQAGRDGPLTGIVRLVTGPDGAPDDSGIFWATGLLSAFLDNAPTYLVFFNLAGGDAQALMGPLAGTLKAISMGAVFFGALSYIGNAPNFMIKAIAEDRGLPMPSFFTYLAYASVLLLPLFAAIAWIQF